MHLEQVGDNGEHDRADHAAKQPRQNSAEQQSVVVLRRRAKHGSEHEANVEEQEQVLTIETIGKTGSKDARNSRAKGVGRNRGAERQHDGEIHNDRELRERQQCN